MNKNNKSLYLFLIFMFALVFLIGFLYYEHKSNSIKSDKLTQDYEIKDVILTLATIQSCHNDEIFNNALNADVYDNIYDYPFVFSDFSDESKIDPKILTDFKKYYPDLSLDFLDYISLHSKYIDYIDLDYSKFCPEKIDTAYNQIEIKNNIEEFDDFLKVNDTTFEKSSVISVTYKEKKLKHSNIFSLYVVKFKIKDSSVYVFRYKNKDDAFNLLKILKREHLFL